MMGGGRRLGVATESVSPTKQLNCVKGWAALLPSTSTYNTTLQKTHDNSLLPTGFSC